MSRTALLLIDIQNDFLPGLEPGFGSALAVPDGGAVIDVANSWIPKFQHVFATQDWHPADHLSFATQHPGRAPGDVVNLAGLDQVLWPDHCVQGTVGAQFAERLELTDSTMVVRKGQVRSIDSYSGFFDNGHRHATELHARLQAAEIESLTLLGLATDYCVRFTALDAVQLGYQTRLVTDGCRGVNLHALDSQNALDELKAAGVELL
jgi:nicotinamidase/pyrazinamidase